MNRANGGRPRLDSQEGFVAALLRVLPRVYAGNISQRRAAKELGISARTLNRYAERIEGSKYMLDEPTATVTWLHQAEAELFEEGADDAS